MSEHGFPVTRAFRTTLSLHRQVRVRENPYSGVFYEVIIWPTQKILRSKLTH